MMRIPYVRHNDVWNIGLANASAAEGEARQAFNGFWGVSFFD